MEVQAANITVFEPFLKFVIEFHNKADLYGSILKNEIKSNPGLLDDEKGLINEAFLIKITAEWELFLHNILAYCVAMDTSVVSKYLELSLPAKMSFGNAFAVLNGLDFISITSVNELKNISKKILFDAYNPFKQFDNSFINTIDEVYALRNYIAHKRKRSKIRLSKMYRDKHHINEFITPGKFLLTNTTFQGVDTTICDNYFGMFLCIAVEIWKILDKKSYEFVYEDDSTKEGMFLGMAKMRAVFEKLTLGYRLD
jgi:hypothetical protein